MSSSTESQRRRRKRLREEGQTEILIALPREHVELLDRLRAMQGAANRGDVIASLIRKLTEAERALSSA